MAFDAVEPTGSVADDWRMAMLCHSSVAAMNGDKTPPIKQFLPKWDSNRPVPPAKDTAQILHAWAKRHNDNHR